MGLFSIEPFIFINNDHRYVRMSYGESFKTAVKHGGGCVILMICFTATTVDAFYKVDGIIKFDVIHCVFFNKLFSALNTTTLMTIKTIFILFPNLISFKCN